MARGAASIEESAVGRIVRRAPELFESDRHAAEAAAIAIARWLTRAPITIVAALDRTFRSRLFHRRLGVDIQSLSVQEYRSAKQRVYARRDVVGVVGSVNRNGHVRGEALPDLIDNAPIQTVALLTRLNDPVPEVGAAAWRLLAPLINEGRAPTLARCLPIVEAQRRWVRAGQFPAAERIRRLLRESAAGDRALWDSARMHDSATRRASCRMLVEKHQGHEAIGAVFAIALEDPDPRTRRWAAESIANRKLTPDRVAARLLPRLAGDPSPALRLTALRLYARDDRNVAALERAALDDNAAVRFFARKFLLRRDARFDYRRRALSILADPGSPTDRVVGALAVLSESGTAADAGVIERFVADPRARVAREAWRALKMLPSKG